MKLGFAIIAVVAAASVGCAGKPELTESQEYFVGRAVVAQAIESAEVYDEPGLQEYVALVGNTVALESDRPETFKGYHFGILTSNDVNAFAAPSGFIFVTTGALKAMQTEDELAAVLAHEIAHVNLRHPEIVASQSAEKSGALSIISGVGTGLSIFGGFVGATTRDTRITYTVQQVATLVQGLGGTVAEFVGNILINGYGSDSELAADALAVEFLLRPGVRYDPRALGGFISRLPKDVDRGGPFWARSNHPGLEERVAKIEEEIRKRGAVPATDPARTKRFLEKTSKLR